MKKVLLASTALVMSAGFAAADVTLSGTANAGIKHLDGDSMLHWEVDFGVSGSGETDGGIAFGASLDLDNADGQEEGSMITDGEVFISGAFGTVTVGNVDPATDGFGIADVGFDGLGVDDFAEGGRTAGTSADVHYSYNAGDFGIILAMNSDEDIDDFSAAITFSAGDFTVGLGVADNGDDQATTIDLGANLGDVSVNAILTDNDGTQWMGLDASFAAGDATITVALGDRDGDQAVGVGVSVPMGTGLTFNAGIADLDGVNAASAGFEMSF